MTPEQFCYWLQGFAETSDEPPHEHQWDTIKHHLNTVFNKITPNRGGGDGEGKPKVLNEEDLKKISQIRPGLTCSDAPVNPFDPHPLCSHDTRYC